MKSGRFHEICEIWQISPVKSGRFHPWNPVDFMKSVKSGRFHPWNPADFTLKSSRFHEIQWISWNLWNLADFTHEIWQISPMKSSGFHEICEIWQISPMKSGRFHPEIQQISWNPVDFMKSVKSGRFHPWNLADFIQISPVKSTQNYKSKCFSKNSSVWWMQGGGFHPWNPPDFTLKSGGFHLWNLADFTQISPVKSTQNYKSKCFSKNSSVWWMQGGGYDQGFHEIHPEIWWISPMKSGRFHPRFHLWNPPKIIKASVSAKTLQFDECRVGDFTLEIQWNSPWNLVDFNHEIWWILPVKSTQNYKSKCFSKNSSVWWMQGGGYDEGFHLWNPAEFTQISSMKSTQNYKSKCFSKNSSVWWMQGGGYDQGFHEICWISHEIHMKFHWISKLWAFAWWSSIGLLFFQKTNQKSFCWNIWFYKVWGGFHLKSTRFHADFMKSGRFHVKSKDLLQGIVTLWLVFQ